MLAGPPQAKRVLPPSQAAYEHAMGRYAMARDARRKLPRRTKDEDASRKRAWRQAPYSRAVQNVVVEVGRKQAPHLNAADVLRGRERERSQRRRDAAKAAAAEAAEAARESDEACERRMEQEALLAAIETALSMSDSLKMDFHSVGYWDEPLCLAIQTWARSSGELFRVCDRLCQSCSHWDPLDDYD